MLLHVGMALEELVVSEFPRVDFEVDHDLLLTRNREVVHELISALEPSIGPMIVGTIANADTVAYSMQADPAFVADQMMVYRIGLRFLALAQVLCQGLWLVKDNSVNPGDVLLRVVNPDGRPLYRYQKPGVIYRCADTSSTVTTFSAEEVDRAIAYSKQIIAIVPQIEIQVDAPPPSGASTDSRTARVSYFLDSARGDRDVAARIAAYCMCFETLFSTDTAGVSHRVAERTALFVGATGTERRAIYQDMKALYAIRSKLVHGSHIKGTALQSAPELSIRGDDYLRRCIRAILGDQTLLELFSGTNTDAIDHYFIERLFP